MSRVVRSAPPRALAVLLLISAVLVSGLSRATADAAQTALYNGEEIPLPDLAAMESAGMASIVYVGGPLVHVAPDGIDAWVFDTEEESDAFLAEHGVHIPTGDELEAIERQARWQRARQATEGNVSTLSCPSLTYGARWYEDPSCGGSHLGVFQTDAVPYMSIYGWNDRASSLAIRTSSSPCYQWVRYYQHANYGIPTGIRWGFSGNWTEIGGWDDEISSFKAGCS